MEFLEVTNVGKKQNNEWVIRNFSLQLPAFRKLAIAGETGSGKSSILKIIAGINNPDEGQVSFEGVRVKKVPEEKLLPGHPGIAYLSQEFELSHNVRVEEVLSYANELEAHEARRLYIICQVDHLLKRRTDQLSGGERQRIALARLLTTSPRLLLLDEPYSNLDSIHKETLKAVIEDIAEKLRMTCVLVSHDPLDTISWAEEIIVLRQGMIVQHEKPHDIFYHPADDYTARLFGKYNHIDPVFKKVFGAYLEKDSSKWCIRPNEFNITNQPPGVRGIIKEILFLGAGYELLIQTDGLMIQVLVANNCWNKGDSIYITPDACFG